MPRQVERDEKLRAVEEKKRLLEELVLPVGESPQGAGIGSTVSLVVPEAVGKAKGGRGGEYQQG